MLRNYYRSTFHTRNPDELQIHVLKLENGTRHVKLPAAPQVTYWPRVLPPPARAHNYSIFSLSIPAFFIFLYVPFVFLLEMITVVDAYRDLYVRKQKTLLKTSLVTTSRCSFPITERFPDPLQAPAEFGVTHGRAKVHPAPEADSKSLGDG